MNKKIKIIKNYKGKNYIFSTLLFVFSLFLLIVFLSPLTKLEGLIGAALLLIGFYPLKKWIINPKNRLPIFESFSFTIGIYYGLPILAGTNGSFNIWSINEGTRIEVGIMMLIALILSQLTFNFIYSAKSSAFNKMGRVMPFDLAKVFMFLFLIIAVCVGIGSYMGLRTWLGVWTGTVATATTGLGMVASFVLARLAGQGNLSKIFMWFIFLLIGLNIIVQIGSGLLAPAVRFLIPPVIGYAVGKGQMPWKIIGISLLMFIVLSIGKYDMRNQYWGYLTQAGSYDILTLPERLNNWVGYSINALSKNETKNRYSPITERINLASVMGIIVEKSPEQKQYLFGKTYYPLIYLWVPRFLWPNKPTGHAANLELVLYYGIQDSRTAARTSIGVGVFGEAYANFGWYGVIGLSILFSSLLGLIQKKLSDANPLSMRSFIAAPFFVTALGIEAPLTSIVTPLVQALIVIIMVFLFLTVKKRYYNYSKHMSV